MADRSQHEPLLRAVITLPSAVDPGNDRKCDKVSFSFNKSHSHPFFALRSQPQKTGLKPEIKKWMGRRREDSKPTKEP